MSRRKKRGKATAPLLSHLLGEKKGRGKIQKVIVVANGEGGRRRKKRRGGRAYLTLGFCPPSQSPQVPRLSRTEKKVGGKIGPHSGRDKGKKGKLTNRPAPVTRPSFVAGEKQGSEKSAAPGT